MQTTSLYEVVRGDGGFSIIETPTKQVIKKEMKNYDAEKLKHHLNRGGGFDGYTPAFFVRNENGEA